MLRIYILDVIKLNDPLVMWTSYLHLTGNCNPFVRATDISNVFIINDANRTYILTFKFVFSFVWPLTCIDLCDELAFGELVKQQIRSNVLICTKFQCFQFVLHMNQLQLYSDVDLHIFH